MPFFFIWNLWKTRNCLIFEDVAPNIPRLCHAIMSEVDSYLVPLVNIPKGRIIGDPSRNIYPMVFYDGAAADLLVGVGACIWMNDQHFLSIKLGCGHNTNIRADLLALWHHYTLLKILGYRTYISFTIPL